eukprot:scaffold58038_cov17-Tisochrysis_lutea.AAC.3
MGSKNRQNNWVVLAHLVLDVLGVLAAHPVLDVLGMLAAHPVLSVLGVLDAHPVLCTSKRAWTGPWSAAIA